MTRGGEKYVWQKVESEEMYGKVIKTWKNNVVYKLYMKEYT